MRREKKSEPHPHPVTKGTSLPSLLRISSTFTIMKTIMATTPHDSSFSFSRRHFNWRKKGDKEEEQVAVEEEALKSFNSFSLGKDEKEEAKGCSKRRLPTAISVARLRSVINRRILVHLSPSLGRQRVIGTLFGYRRGHVHFAFQEDSKANPAFLIELATPTNGLVREMATGLVRIALECDKKRVEVIKKRGEERLLDEPLWRSYCNGKKCGYGMRRECGAEELKVLKAVEPISMGAGVLPGVEGSSGELMYMRAKFERVMGSRDSEAFYMMNPDCNGGPELSIYLLRV